MKPVYDGTVIIRNVTLPNGKKCKEIETTHVGGSETQVSYEYKRFGFRLNKLKFNLDYWGRICENKGDSLPTGVYYGSE
jgi:hypothetical protein